MAKKDSKIEMPNSERAPLPGAVRIGPCDPHEVIDVTIVVRRRSKGSGRFPRIEELGRRPVAERRHLTRDRKSTRLNSSHGYISYAVFCLKKKKQSHQYHSRIAR